MTDLLDEALGDSPALEEAVQPQPEEVAAPEPQPEVVEPEPEADQPEPEPAPREVPLAAMLAERDRAQALQAQLDAISRTQQPEPQPIPDVLEDQDGFVGSITAQVNHAVQNAQANMSQAFAEREHGRDNVAAALQALQAANDPAAENAIKSSAMPYQELMVWHEKQAALAEIGTNPAEYKARVEAKIRAEIEAEMVAKQAQTAAATPAPTLSNQPNVGSRTGPAFTPTNLDDVLGG